ncbi:Calx-beta domain-containing protein, partial [Balneatrix alpica]
GGNTWTAYPAAGITGLPEGDSSLKVRVKTLTDNIDEADETFDLTVELSSAGNTLSATGQATILDNDVPTVSVNAGVANNNIDINEGDKGIFTVDVSKAAAGSTLALQLNNGSALVGDDYAAAFEVSTDGGANWTAYSSALTLSAGVSQVLVRATTLDDSINEPNETFTLKADLNSNGQGYSATGQATILDNDVPTVSVNAGVANNNIDINEGD